MTSSRTRCALAVALALAPAMAASQIWIRPIAFAGPDQSAAQGVPILLTGMAEDPMGLSIDRWRWALASEPAPGSGVLQDVNSPTVVFVGSVPGDYVLSLVVSDRLLESDPSYVTIHVAPNVPPVAVIAVDRTSGHAPFTVFCFDGRQSYDPEGVALASYSWDFGDGTAQAATPTACHTYLSAGTFTATLTVTDFLLASGVASSTITVGPNHRPIADAGSSRNVWMSELVTLTGSAVDPDGDPIVAWQFIVQSFSSEPDHVSDIPYLVFTPTLPVDYYVTLLAFDGNLWSDPATIVLHSVERLPPVAVISVDKTSGTVPLTLCFDGTQSYDPYGLSIASYFWDLGDGSYVRAPTVCHTYQTPGMYAVTLTVLNLSELPDVETLTITALPPNHPPLAAPTATPPTGSAPLTVQLAANASDTDGDPLTYSWDLGDGGTSTEANPSHVYASAGTYFAWLTVADGQASVSASLTIVVEPAIELNVTKADIDFKSKRSLLADVEIQAELYAVLPAPDDVVALHVDGALVFAVPFSQLEPMKHHGAVVPGVYLLRAKGLWVRLDFTEGRMAVNAEKARLTGYDPRNGVDIEVMLGGAMAVDNVRPVDDERGERHYRHWRPERGRGKCWH